MAPPTLLALPLRLLAALLLIVAAVALYRWLHARAPVLGWFFAAGLALRAAAGVSLFLISVYELPAFSSLQLGGGFWSLALDARSYYDLAATAVAGGLQTIETGTPSPFYVQTLAIWMAVFGVSPAAGVLLNAACYAVSVALIVVIARSTPGSRARDLWPALLPVAALTLSPSLLVFSTQPLKDPLCVMLVIMAFAGLRFWWDALDHSPLDARIAATGALLVTLAIFGLAGIRAYAVVFLLAATGIAGVVGIIRRAPLSRAKRAAIHLPLAVLAWGAFALGGGVYYQHYVSVATGAIEERAIVEPFDNARAAFVATGGDTSTVASPRRPLTLATGVQPGTADDVRRARRERDGNQRDRDRADEVRRARRQADLALWRHAIQQARRRIAEAQVRWRVSEKEAVKRLQAEDRARSGEEPAGSSLLAQRALAYLAGGPGREAATAWLREAPPQGRTPLPAEPGSAPAAAADLSTGARFRDGLRGFAVATVPISLLRALSVVEFDGGKSLLIVTDLDTLVVDASLLAVLWVVAVAVRRREVSPAAVAGLVFGIAILAAMAYVVTNYGTLFRLRLMGLAAVWACFALIHAGGPGAPADARQTRPAA